MPSKTVKPKRLGLRIYYIISTVLKKNHIQIDLYYKLFCAKKVKQLKINLVIIMVFRVVEGLVLKVEIERV